MVLARSARASARLPSRTSALSAAWLALASGALRRGEEPARRGRQAARRELRRGGAPARRPQRVARPPLRDPVGRGASQLLAQHPAIGVVVQPAAQRRPLADQRLVREL